MNGYIPWSAEIVKGPERIGNWTPEGIAERASLRSDFRELTPVQRVEQVFELSRFMTQLAPLVPELDSRTMLRQLVESDIPFLLIGGGALGYHGYIRATPEVEIVPEPDGFGNRMLVTRSGRLRMTQRIEGRSLWEELLPGAIEDSVAGLPIKVVSYEDLVRLKELAGRPEDLADLQRLREARES